MAKKVNRIDVYKDAAAMTKTPLPKEPMRTAKLMDGVVWDGEERQAVRRRLQDQGGVSGGGRAQEDVDSADQPAASRGAAEIPSAAARRLPVAQRAGVAGDRRRVARRPRACSSLALGAGRRSSAAAFPIRSRSAAAAAKIFADPFYSKGPNDQGIGWNVLSSLKRVGIGFGLAALVGIPLGFAIGRFRFLAGMAAPIIALLKPVSPLAWLPIGLLVFKAANPAAIYVIFVCSLWPMIVNTAVGVRQIPQDYLNVARVLNLSEWKVFTKILFPAVLPYMITGVRLSIGVAWLVIVAAEMLTGGVGIGFWVWDEWNNLKVEHIIIAIFTIGVVGLLLEQALMLLARRFSYWNLRRYLSVEGVGMTFESKKGDFVALAGIDLAVRKGEFVTLIGHSGCGKTHAAQPGRRACSSPTEGAILLAEQARSTARAGPRRGVPEPLAAAVADLLRATCTSRSSGCSEERS